MQYHSILCFTNPIRSEEGNAQVENQDCDDTVASTVYFDAKYEHVIQTKPPMPLYMEYSVLVTEERGANCREWNSQEHPHVYGRGKYPKQVVRTKCAPPVV